MPQCEHSVHAGVCGCGCGCALLGKLRTCRATCWMMSDSCTCVRPQQHTTPYCRHQCSASLEGVCMFCWRWQAVVAGRMGCCHAGVCAWRLQGGPIWVHSPPSPLHHALAYVKEENVAWLLLLGFALHLLRCAGWRIHLQMQGCGRQAQCSAQVPVLSAPVPAAHASQHHRDGASMPPAPADSPNARCRQPAILQPGPTLGAVVPGAARVLLVVQLEQGCQVECLGDAIHCNQARPGQAGQGSTVNGCTRQSMDTHRHPQAATSRTSLPQLQSRGRTARHRCSEPACELLHTGLHGLVGFGQGCAGAGGRALVLHLRCQLPCKRRRQRRLLLPLLMSCQ